MQTKTREIKEEPETVEQGWERSPEIGLFQLHFET